MPSPEEIEFAQNRFALQSRLNDCFATAEEILGIHCDGLSANLDSVTGPILSHTIANQHLTHERLYGATKVGYIIAADHEWAPIVFITSSAADPIPFQLDRDLNDFPKVRKALTDAIRAAAK
jgi:hypothetical protein